MRQEKRRGDGEETGVRLTNGLSLCYTLARFSHDL